MVSRLLTLEIKLDCQKEKGGLAHYQIQQFDKYRDTYFPNDDLLVEIIKEKSYNYDWEN